MSRVVALLTKVFTDLRDNPGVFVPAILTATIAIVMPFFVAVLIPAWTGEALSNSSDFQIALDMYRTQTFAIGLEPEAAVQAWIFQQFLPLLVLAPVAASMSVAAYTVIGEKQARTLEPLLATPITTIELLSAKVLGALVPAIALTLASFLVYGAGIALLARPGAVRVLLAPRSLGMVFLLGPLAALAALQLAVVVSSRVNDARSAQQIGALIILPIAGLLVGQLTGAVTMSGPLILVIAVVLLALNVALMRVGVRLFDRETILTRWT
jgi:ABC-2 type transport system permease protein